MKWWNGRAAGAVAVGTLLALAAPGVAAGASGRPEAHTTTTVRVLGHCPTSDLHVTGVSNPDPSPTSLAPAGAIGGVVCSYRQLLNVANPGSLLRSTTLDADQAHVLSAAVHGVTITGTPHPIPSCPDDVGTYAVIALRYASGSTVDLWYDLGGCEILSNGRASAWFVANPSFAQFRTAVQGYLKPSSTPPPRADSSRATTST